MASLFRKIAQSVRQSCDEKEKKRNVQIYYWFGTDCLKDWFGTI